MVEKENPTVGIQLCWSVTPTEVVMRCFRLPVVCEGGLRSLTTERAISVLYNYAVVGWLHQYTNETGQKGHWQYQLGGTGLGWKITSCFDENKATNWSLPLSSEMSTLKALLVELNCPSKYIDAVDNLIQKHPPPTPSPNLPYSPLAMQQPTTTTFWPATQTIEWTEAQKNAFEESKLSCTLHRLNARILSYGKSVPLTV
eukprot:TRINITY_DN67281_c4_g2_i2.p1 TRINITY_DN67281_c4_g2~~TRINITY_DN67281_c4_g2_i2.p1  ORF type:complete len:200 (+),score=10.04 TRINITY_DN67281_c4_g2_i2:243-842(+)